MISSFRKQRISLALGQLSIRWLFVLALLPGILVGIVMFYQVYEGKRSDLEVSAQQTARALSQAVEKDLAGITRNLQILATSPHLRNADLKAFYSQAAEILAAAEPLVGAIVLIDDSGQQILNTLRPWGQPLPRTGNPEFLKKILETWQPAVSDLYIGGADKRPYVAVGVPVRLQGNGYALMMGIPAERLAQLLVAQNLPHGWIAALIDSSGKVIARSENQAGMVGKPSRPELMAMIAKRTEGTMWSRTLEGIPSFLAFHRSVKDGWSMAVAMPRTTLYANLEWPVTLAALAIVMSLIGGVLVSRVFSDHVRASLQALEAATVVAAKGDVNAVVSTLGPREIAHLAQRFNEMQAARREARSLQRRIKRALLLLNELNTALLAAEDEKSLLPEACRRIVETGGYSLAWVGFAANDEEKSVVPVAVDGAGQAYVHTLRISWADNDSGRGPTGLAIRTGKPQVNRNTQTNPAVSPWKAMALCHGLRSSLALPLIVDGTAIGALSVYAPEPDAFGDEEVGLLEKLASNLAFGIERLRIRNRLAATNKELQSFTYAASHDMKGPLQRISAFSHLLEKKMDGRLDEEAQTILAFIRDNTKRMMTLVQDLLDHARMEQQPFHLQAVSLAGAVDAILQEYKRDFEDAGAALVVAVPEASVSADPVALAQVLRNLIGNALKYAAHASPPSITLGGHCDTKTCSLWVQDNGVGFDMAYHDTIFEIFRRLHTHAEFPGSGIGLALVKKAMERMGGRVWAQGIPGEGATFYIELPRTEANAATENRDTAETRSSATL